MATNLYIQDDVTTGIFNAAPENNIRLVGDGPQGTIEVLRTYSFSSWQTVTQDAAEFISEPQPAATLDGNMVVRWREEKAGTLNSTRRSYVYIYDVNNSIVYDGGLNSQNITWTGYTDRTRTFAISNLVLAAGWRVVHRFQIVGSSGGTYPSSMGLRLLPSTSVDFELPYEVAAETPVDFNATPATASGLMVAPAVDPNAPIPVTFNAAPATVSALMPDATGFGNVAYAIADAATHPAGTGPIELATSTSFWANDIQSGLFKFGFEKPSDVDVGAATLHVRVGGNNWGEEAIIHTKSIDSAWVETNDTAAPSFGARSGETKTFAANSPDNEWYTFDVTNIVADWTPGVDDFGIWLSMDPLSPRGRTFWARESGYVAYLELTYAYPVSTTATPATGSGLMPAVSVDTASGVSLTAAPMTGSGLAAAAVYGTGLTQDANPMLATGMMPHQINAVALPATANADMPMPGFTAVIEPNVSFNASVMSANGLMADASGIVSTNISVAGGPMDGSALSTMPIFSSDTDELITATPMTAEASGPYAEWGDETDPFYKFVLHNTEGDPNAEFYQDDIDLRTTTWLRLNETSGTQAENLFIGYNVNNEHATYINNPQIGLEDAELLGRKYVRLDGDLNQRIDFNRWEAEPADSTNNTMSFAIRTTSHDTNLIGNIRIAQGRIVVGRAVQTGTGGVAYYDWLFGNQNVADGEWHFITVSKPDRLITVLTVDGNMDALRIQDNAARPRGFSISPSPGAVVEIAEFIEGFNTPVDGELPTTGIRTTNWFKTLTHRLQRVFYTWVIRNPFRPAILDGSAEILQATGKGNKLRAAVLYYDWTNLTTAEVNLWNPNTQKYHFSWYTPRVDAGGFVWNDYMVDHYGMRAPGIGEKPGDDYIPGYGYRTSDWEPRWVDCMNDIDLSGYDLVFIADEPPYYPGGSTSGQIMENFYASFVEAISTHNIPTMVLSPNVALGMGLVSGLENQLRRRYNGSSEYYFNMILENMGDTEKDLTVGAGNKTVVPESRGQLADQFNQNVFEVVGQIPGLTDIVDEGRWKWDEALVLNTEATYNASPWIAWKLVFNRAWELGDRVLLGIRTFMGNSTDKYLPNYWIWGAPEGKHIGTPILKMVNTFPREPGGELVATDNKELITSFIVEPGVSVYNKTLTAPVYVDFVLTSENRQKTLENKTGLASYWDYFGGRNRISRGWAASVDEETGEVSIIADDRPDIVVPTQYYQFSQTRHRALEYIKGEAWKIPEGDALPRPQPMDVASEMPEPVVTADSSVVITAQPMRANGNIINPPAASPADNVNLALPMTATGIINTPGMNIYAGPMTGFGSVPLAQARASGDKIVMTLWEPDFTMMVRR